VITREDLEAYLVGLICGDGHIEPNKNRVIIFSSDKRFLKIIRDLTLFLYKNRGSLFYDKKAREWKLALSSKLLRNDLIIRYDIPTGNKSEKMIIPKLTYIQKLKFITGLYDAEGWYELDKEKYYRIRIKMKNKNFIKFVHNTLKEQKIHSLFYNKGEGVYSIDINKQDQVKKFLRKFDLYHPKWLLLDSVMNSQWQRARISWATRAQQWYGQWDATLKREAKPRNHILV